jgi:PAS domain S-box-containing protein
LWSTDANLRITSSRGRALENLGLKPDELVGYVLDTETSGLIISPEGLEAHRRALQGEAFSYRGESRGRTYQNHITPFVDELGEIIGCIGLGLDVTEQVQAELAYHEAQQRLRTVVDNAPILLWVVDRDLKLILVEGQAIEALARDPRQRLGRSVRDILARRGDLLVRIERALEGQSSVFIAPSLFDENHLMEMRYAPYLDEQGQVIGVIGVGMLVTERVRAEERLAYQAMLLENVNDAIVATDSASILTVWNRAAENQYGWTAEEALGRPYEEVLRPEYHQPSRDVVMRRLAETGQYRVELAHHHKDGQRLEVEVHAIALKNAEGQTSGYVAVNRDITRRKEADALLKRRSEELAARSAELAASNQALAEQGAELLQRSAELTTANRQLEESKWLFEGLFESAPDATFLVDADGRILQANRQALAAFGYTLAELSGQSLETLLPEDLREPFLSLRSGYFLRPTVGPIQLDMELEGLRRGGERFPIDVTLNTLQVDGDIRLIYVMRDVTRRKLAEIALRNSEARFRTIFEESALGIALKDLDGRILEGNPALQEMLGYSADELRGKHFEALTYPADVPAEQELFRRLAAGEIQRYRLEKRYRCKNGNPLWARLAVSVVDDGAGRPQFTVIMVENIHEHKSMEAELAEVHRRLMDSREDERMALARDLHDGPMQELYGVVYGLGELRDEAAELSSTLPAVSQGAAGAVDALSIPGQAGSGGNGADQAGSENLPDRLQGLQTHILSVIQELRNFTTALRPPTLTPFGLEATIQAHAEAFQEDHPEIELVLELQPDEQVLPERVRVALYRIYQQSLANVVRHAGASRVKVRFAFDAQKAVLEIEDDGQGFHVPPRWLDFVRGGHLGLAGAAERAEAIGGMLRVESAPGRGTCLTVTAPYTTPEAGK